jgi:hypothetical protein
MDGVSVVAAAGGSLEAAASSFVTGGVVGSSELIVGAVVSAVGSAVVADVEELSGGGTSVDVDSPRTAGVEVDETKVEGGALETYAPFDSSAYWPTSRSPLSCRRDVRQLYVPT